MENFPTDFEITKINEFVKVEKLDIEIGCYIMNVKGNGELETLLKAIKSEESIYADCLEAWKKCLEENKKDIWDFESPILNDLKTFLLSTHLG